ncbi:unnamed protein product, partial [Discosporangium mesarthrocarpum]
EEPGGWGGGGGMRGRGRMQGGGGAGGAGGKGAKGGSLKYGFGNGGVFTLKEFALMADEWRSDYLTRRGLGNDPTEEEVEQEFWRLVGPNPPEDDVKVLYGSDLDTGSVGSGFPTRDPLDEQQSPWESDMEQWEQLLYPKYEPFRHMNSWGPSSQGSHCYEEDGWNLNCLPTADGSLLQYLGRQIQGVMIPWLYVGMAF